MMPGPTLVIKAPGCKRPLKVRTILSGNTFGATQWSDGKLEAPMLPDRPWLRKSPSEGVLFWMDEIEEIDQCDSFGGGQKEDKAWKDLEYAEEPSENDYFRALEEGIANTPERLQYLRKRIWWVGNDPIRREECDQLPAKHRENLLAYLEQLPDGEFDEKLEKVEVLRELGRFDEAAELLGTKFPKDYARVVALFGRLIEERESRVAKI